MTHFLKRNLKQTITYWPNPAPDGWGGKVFDDAVIILGRWEEKEDIILNAQGEEERSSITVFLSQDVDVGGYLALGDYTGSSAYGDPAEVSGSRPIRAFEKIPSLKATKFSRKAWL
jgi:hypothetical protein